MKGRSLKIYTLGGGMGSASAYLFRFVFVFPGDDSGRAPEDVGTARRLVVGREEQEMRRRAGGMRQDQWAEGF